jgi:hypothetical protein
MRCNSSIHDQHHCVIEVSAAADAAATEDDAVALILDPGLELVAKLAPGLSQV